MLSAISSASYKSSFEPEGIPRDERQILRDIDETEGEISRLLSHFKNFHCDLDPQSIDSVSMFEELDMLRNQLPQFFDVLDDLEDELCRARHEPDYLEGF